ncbi:hypothetical protein JF546_01655 [Nitratireductor aquimarinus]|uniref:hypothetical protein n=1 Tax=Nitratireductor aquimarinus TaxID=889300 RepID=UPI001A8D4968|nr:hypothetical protein [Nitratireductor aquimarinus]MBN8241714.1 hypothetical protein [Nitratireductor aquimarinus]MBY6130100.1 hypothetical protein [Nitratireductor aquimarinus]MCA1304229.1 hypothetical protein [Nitratireductor aquimarinus]
MLSHATKLKTLSLAALLSATALQSAQAWEADEVAARYKTLLGDQGVEAEWTAARKDGDSIVLEGASFGVADVDKKANLGDLVLEDVSETDTVYEIGRVAVDDFQQSEDDFDIALKGVSIEELILPKEAEDAPYGGLMQYRRFALESARVGKNGDEPIFTLGNLVADTDLGDGANKMSFEGSAESFSLDLSKLTDSREAHEQLKEYGYEQLSGRVDMAGSWTLDDGRMQVSRYDLKLDNAGTLAITADISGYTPEFLRTLQEMQEKMENGTEEQQQAQGLAMLGLMQQLNLHGASIRFSDASLTGKLIAYVAAQQGVKPEDVANQAKAIVPLMAGQYLGPDLTQSLAKAVTTYLDDPRNLTISIAPEEPMPFAVLMGTAMGSPEALAKQVGLQVQANQ